MFNILDFKNTYQKSMLKNDFKVKQLDDTDFLAFLWNLYTGSFNIIGFETNGFYRYFTTGTESCIDIINCFEGRRTEIEKLIIDI
jgi:hypothetical protein